MATRGQLLSPTVSLVQAFAIAAIAVPFISAEDPVSVDQVLTAAVRSADALALVRQLPADLPEDTCAKLRILDGQLQGRETPEIQELTREILFALGRTGSPRSLGYLHGVFESSPSRRSDVAVAIARFSLSHRRRPEDWRLLVRSLPIVEQESAVEVLLGLRAFSERGTKPEWQRQVILAGLRSNRDGAEAAASLLQHWTVRKPNDPLPESVSLGGWQTWFESRHPELPPVRLPVDPPTAKYKFADVMELLGSTRQPRGDATAGARVYDQALCVKCHRFGSRGEAMGPDLTNVRQRFQVREVVQAILYPSHGIPEEYATTIVLTRDGRTFTGVLAVVGDRLVVLQANGEKAAIDKANLEDTRPSNQSSMPAGLLEPISAQEISDLFAYLFAPPAE